MIQRLRIARAAAEEGGAVLVTFALFAPVAILFISFVIDAGNSWLHARHLQVQADAAALAAAQGFQPCSNTAITAEAQQYGGVSGNPLYNAQVGGTSPSNIHQLINSGTFYNQSSPVDGNVNTAAPCTAKMVDVKMTETNLPWYVQVFNAGFNGVPYIDAQARVEIRQETSIGPGALPVAINDLNIQSAEAFFIDESTGNVLGKGVALTQQGTNNGLSVWSSAANPYSLTVPSGSSSDVGVRIALSGKSNLTGNMTTDCAATAVLCYDSSSGTAQLLDVHGYSTSGTGSLSSPIPRQVIMTPGNCGDQYYTSSYYTTATTCTDGIQANIDFGANPKLNGVTVSAVVGGSSSTLTCTSAQPSVCTGNVSVSTASGRNRVDITVKQGNTTTTLTNVQSTYAAVVSGNAGPIQALGLSENGIGDTSSLRTATTHSLVVNMGITGNLTVAQSVGDPLYTMRFSGTGSQNQSVSCPAANGGSTYADTLASGCAGSYQINQALSCPDNNVPIDCLSPATGNKQNQVAKGINLRVLGSTKPSACTSPNHWSSFPNLSAADPRIVTVFVTPYGSFSGNGGSSQYPIQFLAAFYITGWQDSGNGFNNPCQGNGDDTAQAGTIVGHFISYINTLNTGGSGGTTCVVNSLDECITVMTR